MSTPEHSEQVEQRSSVKISTTAKGDAVPEVKVYEGTTREQMDTIRAVAIATYNATLAAVRS
jgi:hypothetical protein